MTAIAAPGAPRSVDAAGSAVGRLRERAGLVALVAASVVGVGAVGSAVVAATDVGAAGWVAAVAIVVWAAGAVVLAGRSGTGALWGPLEVIAVAAAAILVLTARPRWPPGSWSTRSSSPAWLASAAASYVLIVVAASRVPSTTSGRRWGSRWSLPRSSRSLLCLPTGDSRRRPTDASTVTGPHRTSPCGRSPTA